MAHIRPRSNGTFECRVIHKLLSKPYYSTHDDEASARRYAAQIEAMLNSGEVPNELRPSLGGEIHTPIRLLLRDYINKAKISGSDMPTVEWLRSNVNGNVEDITVKWVDVWIKGLKGSKLTPGTVRKKVESLARGVDWWNRIKYDGGTLPTNPLRTLPAGYSAYGPGDGDGVVDAVRDRRLEPGEWDRIENTIKGVKREDRERAVNIPSADAFLLLFRVITNTGMRLREAYTLETNQVCRDLRTIRVLKSKTGRARNVPITPTVDEWLGAYTPGRQLFFPFWNGDRQGKVLANTSSRLSAQFKRVFEYAKCDDLTEHDLRHEAVCRWVLMRGKDGRWLFRDEEVMKITGHLTQAQFMKYLSLRGSDLADRLW